jgi:hypothetical protein
MRTKEVVQFTRETAAQDAAMKGRHEFQIRAEKDARAVLSKDIKAAWRQHEATHGAKEEQAEQAEQAPARTEAEKITRSGKPDRFGRGRERTRQPRAPRQAREAATRPEIERPASSSADIDREAGNSPVEAGYLAGQFSPAGNEQPPTAQPEAAREHEAGQEQQPAREGGEQQKGAESTPSWTPEDEKAAIEAEYERQEQAARERGPGTGREHE